ncbi:ACP S-malonyltransferase [Kineococcus sp. SYSU DK003]|uniref:ACP S-malonyltransferase n=1 Tax=Kineococcus sp. SYSU DK003 TaxID=3383124 RepID=UPI003D7E6CD1
MTQPVTQPVPQPVTQPGATGPEPALDPGTSVLLAPGQGAQRPGQLTPWLDLPGASRRLEQWSQAAGLDLVAAGTQWPAERILPTEVAQPLLVATSLLVGRELLHRTGGNTPGFLAGHSVGEWTAAALAGVLDDVTTLRLVAARGRAMAACCGDDGAGGRSGMAVVLGGDPAEVQAAVARAGLLPANHNGAGQLVVGGPVEALDALVQDPPRGSAVRRLPVAGAFHTPAMAGAVDALRAATAGVVPADPRRPLLSNADGAVVSSGTEVLRRLVLQVAAPVRWDLCTATLGRAGTGTFVELPPAGALSGMARRAHPGARLLGLREPGDLGTAAELLGR